jgi:hypothetical protein
MKWGELKAKVEEAGVTDDHEVQDVLVFGDDTRLDVTIDDEGKAVVEGYAEEPPDACDDDDETGGDDEDEDEDDAAV